MWPIICHFFQNAIVQQRYSCLDWRLRRAVLQQQKTTRTELSWDWKGSDSRALVDLAVVVVDKNVACAVVSQVRNLQAIGMSNFLWLEGCVDGVHFDHGFRFLCLPVEEWKQEKECHFFAPSKPIPLSQVLSDLAGRLDCSGWLWGCEGWVRFHPSRHRMVYIHTSRSRWCFILIFLDGR